METKEKTNDRFKGCMPGMDKQKMAENKSCRARGDEPKSSEYETVKIEKTKNICPTCEDYSKKHALKPIVVMCCEGGCLRGEIARQATNLLCYELAPEKTVRICLGGAFTKDTGQRALVRNAPKVVALEGCFIKCASRTMKGVITDLEAEVVIANQFYTDDKNLFGIDELPEKQIKTCARQVAQEVAKKL